jgi:hypothetical protein
MSSDFLCVCLPSPLGVIVLMNMFIFIRINLKDESRGLKMSVQNYYEFFFARNNFYYESRNRELQTRPTYECRCDERLKTEGEKSTLLVYTGLLRELKHTKIKTRLINEMFASVMGEYVFLK